MKSANLLRNWDWTINLIEVTTPLLVKEGSAELSYLFLETIRVIIGLNSRYYCSYCWLLIKEFPLIARTFMRKFVLLNWQLISVEYIMMLLLSLNVLLKLLTLNSRWSTMTVHLRFFRISSQLPAVQLSNKHVYIMLFAKCIVVIQKKKDNGDQA